MTIFEFCDKINLDNLSVIRGNFLSMERMIDKIRQQFETIAPIADIEWEEFTSFLHTKKLKKDEFFIEAGQTSSDFAFITKGIVRYIINTFDGNEFNQSFKVENEFILNYYPIMAKIPSPLSIQCLEDTELIVGDYDRMSMFYERGINWNKIARKLLEMNYLNKSWREIQLLTFEAKDRYLNLVHERPDLIKRVPQYHIALHLGINPATLNRLIKKMKQDGELTD